MHLEPRCERVAASAGHHDKFVERILRGLPAGASLDHQVLPGAGHFAFLSPFPPSLASPAFPPSQDPPNFDRAAYQPRLHTEVLALGRSALGR